MNDIEHRLRTVHPYSQQYASGSMILLEAADEIARLQSEVERLRGRLCKTCAGAGMIGGPSPSAPDEGGEPCPECSAWLLRKQAEAVEAIEDKYRPYGLAESYTAFAVAENLQAEAKRLRQQAAESENESA